jgi:hypothetical protein
MRRVLGEFNYNTVTENTVSTNSSILYYILKIDGSGNPLPSSWECARTTRAHFIHPCISAALADVSFKKFEFLLPVGVRSFMQSTSS